MNKNKYLSELRFLLESKGEDEKDVLLCIEYAENLIDLSLPVIFEKEHFALLTGRETQEISTMMATIETKYYTRAEIPKKSGGMRELLIPAMSLRLIQRWILENILQNIPISEHATGFYKNRSIVDNATRHIGQECIINIDLKDFFPSIKVEQVFRIFYYYGYTIEVSYMLSRLCTYDGKLPQGSSASPYISNIVCLRLDKRLSGLANSYKAVYSRYADDITFSGNYGISKITDIARNIICDEGFIVNEKKVRIAYKHERQSVTGLIVSNNKVSVPKKYRKKLQQEIYYCKKYGVSNHLQYTNCDKLFFKDHLYGKAYYVNMVDSESGQKLIEELDNIDWES